MVLRLRQITSSCLLVFNSCLELLEREDFEKLNQITAADQEGNDDGVELLLHLRHVLRQSKDSQTLEGGISNSVLTDCETVAVGAVDVGQSAEGEVGRKHGLSFRFQKYLDAIKGSSEWEDAKARAVCCGWSVYHGPCLATLTDLSQPTATREPVCHQLLTHFLLKLPGRPAAPCGTERTRLVSTIRRRHPIFETY